MIHAGFTVGSWLCTIKKSVCCGFHRTISEQYAQLVVRRLVANNGAERCERLFALHHAP